MNLLEVLAAANPKHVADFIKVLYAACSVFAKDQVDKPLKASATSWLAGAKVIDAKLDTEIVPDIIGVLKGEIDAEDVDFINKLKALRKAINAELKPDRTIDHDSIAMMNATTGYLMTQNQAALKKLIQLAPLLKEPAIVQALALPAAAQKEFRKPLEKIVWAAARRKGATLTREEAEKFKATHPAVYKEYLRLRKGFLDSWKDELRNYVIASKKTLVDFKAASQYLSGKGIEHTLPKGNFDGLVDQNGKIYTKAGKKIQITPQPGFIIEMNPDYDPKADNSYVFITRNDGTGKVSGHVYTEDYRKGANKKKFERVKDLDKVIEGVHRKWLTHLKKNDTSPQCVASTILDILYHFSARIGGRENATMVGGKTVATYGICTLEVRHVKVEPNRVTLSYPGKKAVRQVHRIDGTTLESKNLVKNIALLAKGKIAKDPLFTFDHGTKTNIPMTPVFVNRWFQKLGAPQGVTVHKLRHVRGTEVFVELLEKHEDQIFNRKVPLTEKQATAMFIKLATAVGKLLGHARGVGQQQKVTPATAIQNYIDPAAMLGYFERLNLRAPKFLAKVQN